MLVTRSLHHVGIVQPSESDALTLMQLLGLEEDYRGYVPAWSALCIFCKANGASPIEFVIPDGGPLKKFNKGLGGLHHVALEVPSTDDVARRLGAQKHAAPVRAGACEGCRKLLVQFSQPNLHAWSDGRIC